MKFYAVKKGRQPGVYRTWKEAKKQVNGYSNAEYKSFEQITDATNYLGFNQATAKKLLQKDEDSLRQAIAKIQKASKIKPLNKERGTSKTNKKYFAKIYTDGGTRNTGTYKGGHVHTTDKAAWAYLIEWQQAGKKQSFYDSNGELGATNNKMELTALIEALKKLLELKFNQQPLLFILDSQYVLNPITQGWLQNWKKRGWHKSSKGEIANVEEWQKLDKLLSEFTQAEFKWTKGHAKNRGNEFVDHTLNKFMDQM